LGPSTQRERFFIVLQVLQVIVSVVTLAVTVVLTILVAQWTISQDKTLAEWTTSQDQARLYLSPVLWETHDQINWTITVMIENEGPATATDIVLDISAVLTDRITLKKVEIIHGGTIRELSTKRQTHNPYTGLWTIPYTDYWDRLSVGDEFWVRLHFQVDIDLGQWLFRVHQTEAAKETETIGAGGQYVQTYFLDNIKVSGNKVVVMNSNLWK